MEVIVGLAIAGGTLLLGVLAGMVKVATVYREEWRAAVSVSAPLFSRWTKYCAAFIIGIAVGNGTYHLDPYWTLVGILAFAALSAIVGIAWAVDKYVDRQAGRKQPD